MMKLVVLCCVVAAAAARAPVYFTPAASPPASSFGYAVPLQQQLYNYRGPLSLAPGQPANILAADGRPLDTLDVNLDRSAHFVAKSLDNGSRVLKKRSVTRLAVAPGAEGFSAAVAAGNVGVVGPAGVAAIATNPFGLSVQTVPRTIITNPLAAGFLGLPATVSTGSLAASTPVAAGSLAISTPVAINPLAAVSASAVTGDVGVTATGIPFVRNF